MENRNFIKDVLLGVATGDALGVPVEFLPRAALTADPVTGMRAFGSHRQPAGTWSDDSSLTFCLAEMLCEGYNLKNLAERFISWKEDAYWTAHGRVFDIGIATSAAIYALQKGVEPVLAGGNDEESNGNGSLMRILPLIFYIKNKSVEERFQIVEAVSSLTHRHIRSVIGCFIYLEMALQLLQGKDKRAAYENMKIIVNHFLQHNPICSRRELDKYHRVLGNATNGNEVTFDNLEKSDIYSSGYVLHTLEASIWCILNTDSYEDAVLQAVNLGNDTDTTAAVTGGLAGLIYGSEKIPEAWLQVLAKKGDIELLAIRLHQNLNRSWQEPM